MGDGKDIRDFAGHRDMKIGSVCRICKRLYTKTTINSLATDITFGDLRVASIEP